MKLSFVAKLLFIVFIQNATAQHKYNKFVEGKKVQWAAEFSDTFHFNNPNLSELLRTRFLEGEIKAALVEDWQQMNVVRYESVPAVLRRMRPNEEIAESAFRDSLFSPGAFNDQTKDIVEIKDIIYLEKGKLKSQAYAVSPKYVVQTSWGMVLGISNLFSTAFNEKRNPSKADLRKAVPIGGSSRRILLEDDPGNLLKQLYGQNLLEAIWNDLDGKNFELYRIDSNKRITLKDISTGLIRIPVYDESGNLVRSVDGQLSPESFHSIDLVQSWTYNQQKNRLFGTISHLLLNLKTGTGNSEMIKPLVKIIVM